ncbi:MAG: ABC transporter substrate-binding protein [Phycisphaerae bacterium]
MTVSRRKFLKSSGVALASAAAPYAWARSSPAVHTSRGRPLRVLGTHVTLQEDLRRQAQKDLGFDIEFHPGGSAGVLQKASTRPETFDLYEQWSNSLQILWHANAIQGIDRTRIERWDEINGLTKTGRLTSEARVGAGDAPYKLLYVQPTGELGSDRSQHVSFLPYVHNVDSFGYDTRSVPRGEAHETESWGWLLDERWRGRVGLVNEPTIGIFDAALAAQARGMMSFDDIGNMTRAEIDQLFDILISYKQRGHFNGIWNSVPQSVEFIKNGRVVIESMFSPAVAALNGSGIPVVYAAPREGYRAWHGVMCLSAKTTGREADMAYDYMNWWLSGWPGAFIARQGYYISNPERSRDHLDVEEWDYWYGGKPAAKALRGTDGKISVQPGSSRNGGSYEQRFANVAVWNTVMDTYEYSLLRWYELLST